MSENGRDVDHLTPFSQLGPPCTFDEFIRRYLSNIPGYVGKLFLSYKADSYIRIEDMPQAFTEFIESIGITHKAFLKCCDLKKQNVSNTIVQWDSKLRERVRESEREIFDHFEYF